VVRFLPTLVVLALLGCTAAAFAVTEGLKLQKSAIANTKVDKVVAPDSVLAKKASIRFVLRKPDRVTVEIVNGSGAVVRTLARSRRVAKGLERFSWNGRDDNGEVVPDGTYRPRVHLPREHRTILLPNPIRMDATPPLIRLVSVRPKVFSPDGDARKDFPRILYRTSERARAVVYVNGEQRAIVKRYVRAGKYDWRGRAVRRLAPGRYRIRLRALDLATNLGPPSRAVTVIVRYVELRPHTLRLKTGARFRVRVLTDAKRYTVHLGSLHARRSARVLVLRAPKPGRYVLRVAANGHTARAILTVTR
jgi:hypothetical protein